ncbi:hypothetical protein OOK36_36170 [Streptomyces sp. NBC_00365]|uniref:hypothetical protein n=1 Tax=Streptomyces sp. NBC_00365 TaxID=2975726 RepID=UPI00224DB79D|nr:hypothetical protein [Streptomyces sp. NBC_00365]MCX5094208.1 hypothetical protein [Streptomyces sp. NBC_00365]
MESEGGYRTEGDGDSHTPGDGELHGFLLDALPPLWGGRATDEDDLHLCENPSAGLVEPVITALRLSCSDALTISRIS